MIADMRNEMMIDRHDMSPGQGVRIPYPNIPAALSLMRRIELRVGPKHDPMPSREEWQQLRKHLSPVGED